MKIVLITTFTLFLSPTNPLSQIDKNNFCRITGSGGYELVDSTQKSSLMEQVFETYSEGDINATIQILSEAIEAEPFNEHLYFFRGKLYFQMQDYYYAKWDFLTVRILKPEYPNLSFYLKKTLIMLGELPHLKPNIIK